VLLLPPDQTLLPAGGDPELLLNPTGEFLERVRAAGGHFFLLEDAAGDVGSDTSDAAAGVTNGGAASGVLTQQQGGVKISKPKELSATALYMPTGWWHWVVGLTEWHVVYGGSHYPEVLD